MATKTPRKTTKKTTKKASQKGLSGWIMAPRKPSTMNDVKTAVLLVSLTINLAFFVGWLALRLTNVYDAQVYSILFNH
jgi:hypothetical protein